MGRIFDLADPTVALPDEVVLDASIVVARLLASYPGQHLTGPRRAQDVFRRLRERGAVGIVTPTAFAAVVHAAVRARYTQELAAHRPALAARFGPRREYTWLDLYKTDPSILQRSAGDLERLRRRLATDNVFLLTPDDLDPAAPGERPYDEALVHLVGRYGLDTGDAAMLMEAQRVGVSAIVTLNADLRRAALDFDVYTWP